MKRSRISPASIITFLLFPVLFLFLKYRKRTVIFYSLTAVLLFSGCYQKFFRTNSRSSMDQQTMTALKNRDKYIILHLKDGVVVSLRNVSINNNVLEADTEPVSEAHSKYLHPDLGSSARNEPSPPAPFVKYLHPDLGPSPRYKARDAVMLNEIHLYAEDKTVVNARVSIPVASILRVDIYEKNKVKTTQSTILSSLAIVTVAALTVVLIAAANYTAPPKTSTANCNCPLVYTYSDGRYQFKSGVFSGAVYSSLERTDYLPLENLEVEHGKYLFRIVNNRNEEQFVNHLQLIKVPHPESTKILLDRRGLVHSYQNLVGPVATSIKEDKKGLVLNSRDGNYFNFDQKADSSSDFGSVILTFNKPASARQAKLIINAKNSMWAGVLYNQFSSLFGDKFQQYIKKEDKANKQREERWVKEQALPIMAYIETGKGWKPIDYFPITGDAASRDMIMPVDLSDIKGSSIRIKLETTYMFWDLDFAAVDFSADNSFKPEFINVSAAVKSNSSESEIPNLVGDDNLYSKILENEFISVEFKAPTPISGETDSYFLLSSGYYHSLKQYSGNPNMRALRSFKKKGAFSEYSEKSFAETQRYFANGTKNNGRNIKQQ
jgi:hypothetical protein